MREIVKIARLKKIRVIEDVAQAIGGASSGQAIGQLGGLRLFLPQREQEHLCGEGGIVNDAQARVLRARLLHARCSAWFSPVRKEVVFRDTKPFMGSSMRVSEITGAIISEACR